MERLVEVSNFSCVLQITFTINLFFLYFELKPFVQTRLQAISSERKETFAVLFRTALRQTDPDLQFHAVFLPVVLIFLLDTLAIPLAALGSIISLGLLIGSGFDSGFTVRVWLMAVILLFLFLTPLLYFLLAKRLLRRVEERIRVAAHKLDRQKAEKSPVSASKEPSSSDGV